LAKSGKRVVILSSSPASPNLDPRRVFHRFRNSGLTLLQPVNRAEFDQFIAPVEARLTQIANRVAATVIRPADYFCNNDYCPATDQDGSPLYKDENHLRSASVVQKATFIDKILQP
jgi:SGNH domain (fused to AT3 domains)